MANNNGSTQDPAVQQARKLFLRAFWRLFALGTLGIIVALPYLLGTFKSMASSGGGVTTTDIIAFAVQLIVLMGLWTGVGTVLAPRLRLRSHLVADAWGVPFGRESLRRDLTSALPAGLAIAAVVILLDLVWRPFLGAAASGLGSAAPRAIWVSLAGLFYGGLAEELIMRWGVMSLLVWLGWRFRQGRRGEPHPLVVWPAIVGAALIFGLVHIGAAASSMPGAIVRTVTLNALAGIGFGWLYWRRSLESAMVAHGIFHIIITLVAWSGLLPLAL